MQRRLPIYARVSIILLLLQFQHSVAGVDDHDVLLFTLSHAYRHFHCALLSQTEHCKNNFKMTAITRALSDSPTIIIRWLITCN